MNDHNIITIEAGKRGPRLGGRKMRIAFADVLGGLVTGISQHEMRADYSDLTQNDTRACLAFAADRERRVRTVA